MTRGDSILMRFLKKYPKEELALSMVSIQELYEGRSTKGSEIEDYLLATISPLRILSYTYEAAVLAGKLARDSKVLVELADAAIAATCIINGAQLVTLNKKHFENFENIQILEI